MFRKSLPLLAALAALGTTPQTASAQGTESYLGAIWLNGANFCPRGTAEAAGQLIAINQNTALFSLFGTMYGGDGRTTFALPDLRGRVPIGQGTGPGLSSHQQGSMGGEESVTLSVSNLPPHSHDVTAVANGTNTPGSSPAPAGQLNAIDTQGTNYGTGATVPMAAEAITVSQDTVGGGQGFGIMQPFVTLRWCVNTVGIFPSRN